MAVVFNHAGISQFPGGFFGVDIFFVISGYLISGLVLADVKTREFSSVNFYQRRFRRIIPALLAMMAGTFALAYLYLLPPEMKDFAKTLFTASAGLSNFYFYLHSGYFDIESTASPLLHTWSLAVEEQFYVFFPGLIVLAYRLIPNRMRTVYGTVLALSLACCAYNVLHNTAAAFYLLPSRGWELALGAVLSLENFLPIRGRTAREGACLVGSFLIAIAILGLSSKTAYLGLAAIIPCAGTALIIAAGRLGNSSVSEILASRPSVFVGKISYSLYLWHWPIIVFHRMGFLKSNSALDIPVVIGVSLVLAVLSWKYVETPCRKGQATNRVVITLSLSSLAVVAVASIGIFFSNGLSVRFSPRVNEIASYMHYDSKAQTRAGSCFVSSFLSFDQARCLIKSETKKNYLIIGDSHAAHLWHGLSITFPEINFMQATLSSCVPTFLHASEEQENCKSLTSFIYNDFLPHNKIDGIVLNATWGKIDLVRLSRTIDAAQRNVGTVILIGPMVQYDQGLPRLLALAVLKGQPELPFSHRSSEFAITDKEMRQLAGEKHINYISFFDLLCSQAVCRTTTDGNMPLLYDYGHLTSQGSEQVAAQIRKLQIFP